MIARSLLLPLVLLTAACAHDPSTGSGVVYGEPYFDLKNPGTYDAERLEEYDVLFQTNTAPLTRAWVREADRIIRANNEVYGRKPDTEEDEPWLKRQWLGFSRLFISN